MRHHFRDLYPLDFVVVPKKRRYLHCPQFGMQVSPCYPAHIKTNECQVGMERQHQEDMAVRSALALRQQFMVNGEVLEKVKVLWYLSCFLLQDDNDIQTMQSQLHKAHRTLAQVGQVLQKENMPPRVSAKFYKAIVQSVLLYDSETWVLS